MKDWKKTREGEPANEWLEKRRADEPSTWPYRVISDAANPFSNELWRQAAVALAAEYEPDSHWPVALSMLLPPYPTTPDAWLNALHLASEVSYSMLSSGIEDTAQVRLMDRCLSIFLTSALGQGALVSFEAVDVIGGLKLGTPTFVSREGKSNFSTKLEAALQKIEGTDPKLGQRMRERAEASLEAAAIIEISDAQVAAVDADLRSIRANLLGTHVDELREDLERLGARVRTFAESQAATGRSGGSLRVAVSGTLMALSADAFRVVHSALEAMIQLLGASVSVLPTAVARASVEIICRIDDSNSAMIDDDTDGPSYHAASDRSLTAAVGRVAAAMSPESEEQIPVALGRLMSALAETKLAVEVEAWTPEGEWQITRLDGKDLVRKLKLSRTRAIPMIRSIDVPQANDLHKVFYVAQVAARGEDVKVVGIPDVVQRQWDYYRHAARILGLITAIGTLTPAGAQLVALHEKNERVRRAAYLFEVCEIGQAWLAWANVASATELSSDKATVTRFLTERTASTGSTVGRRADCLTKWLAEFMQNK